MSEKLCKLVKQGKYTAQDRPQGDEFKNFDREALIALIEAQKERIGELLADRLQGEWIDTGKDPDHSHPLTAIWYRCSECGDGTNTKTNYCPNCGARMKGADDENY